ncbi:MAG TPA: hypothetical protein VFV34_19275 [Blastocatellia bacterium]|nr:hypothetical protein [Blastocatellia bacterium]
MTWTITVRAALLVALILFFWMFLSSDGLDQVAEAGGILSPAGGDQTALGHVFAARWRHGMAGGWPLYMPGFFATAVAIWFWSRELPLTKVVVEGIGFVAGAALIASLLAPAGSRLVIAQFASVTKLQATGLPSVPSGRAFALALLTLLSWSSFIIATERAIAGRRLKPLLVPLAFAALLAAARPVTLDDAFEVWGSRALSRDPAAILSFLLMPILAAILVRNVRPRGTREGRQSLVAACDRSGSK